MDSEIMELIRREVALLPGTKSRSPVFREQLYIAGKRKLCAMFQGHEEYVSRAVARKYGL